MKYRHYSLFFVVAAIILGLTGVSQAAPSRDPPACDRANSALICGVERAEDLVRLGATPWVVASDMTVQYGEPPRVLGPGPLQAIQIHTHEVRKLYPAEDSAVDWDRKQYPDCSTPPESLSSHGLNVRALSSHKFRLYVVNHGGRESIEIIDVTVRGEQLKTAWRGCIPAPKQGPPTGIWANSVVPLRNGAVALSGFHVAIWRPGQGWKQLNQPEFRVANGIEASLDGRWLFVADTVDQSLLRIPVDSGTENDVTKMRLGFYPDNLRRGADGYIYVTGPARLGLDAFAIARIDTKAFVVKEIFRSGPEGTQGGFGNPTAVLQVDDTFWVASGHKDRIAILRIKP